MRQVLILGLLLSFNLFSSELLEVKNRCAQDVNTSESLICDSFSLEIDCVQIAKVEDKELESPYLCEDKHQITTYLSDIIVKDKGPKKGKKPSKRKKRKCNFECWKKNREVRNWNSNRVNIRKPQGGKKWNPKTKRTKYRYAKKRRTPSKVK